MTHIDINKKKCKSLPLWGGKPLFKNFDKYECRECKRIYLEANLIPKYYEKNNFIYFCIRCYNKKEKIK